MSCIESPSSGLITQAAYALRRGVHKSAVTYAVRDGRIATVGPNKLIDPEVADADWDANTDPSSPASTAPGNPNRPAPNGSKGAASASMKLHDHRTRHEELKVQLAEMEIAERNGQLVSAAEVEHAAFEHARSLRDALMLLPKDLSIELAAARTPLDAERILAEGLRKALAGLGDG